MMLAGLFTNSPAVTHFHIIYIQQKYILDRKHDEVINALSKCFVKNSSMEGLGLGLMTFSQPLG